ncbi:MAG: hypothetical protein ACJ8GN_23805 [Longimicrobiaceae bacterium]
MTRLSLLLLPVFAAACTTAPGPGPAPMSPPPAPPAMAMSGFPMGTYTTTIAAADVPASVGAEERAAVVGAWEIAFGANGHALVNFNGRQVVDAPFQVSGNTLTLTADTGEYACNSNARYTWHAAGGELHLTRVEDSCGGRMVVLTAHPLVLRR